MGGEKRPLNCAADPGAVPPAKPIVHEDLQPPQSPFRVARSQAEPCERGLAHQPVWIAIGRRAPICFLRLDPTKKRTPGQLDCPVGRAGAMHRGRTRASAASAARRKGAQSAGSSDADGDQAFWIGAARERLPSSSPPRHGWLARGPRGKLSRPRTPLEPWLTLRRPCIYLPYTGLSAPMLKQWLERLDRLQRLRDAARKSQFGAGCSSPSCERG
jgi:hypothetical protein